MSTRALRTAASGMYAQQINIEVISNNISNINTTGYKKNKAEFVDMIYQEVSTNPEITGLEPNSSANPTVQVGNGVQVSAANKIFKQGDLTETSNSMDMAIFGEGFFQVRRPDGSLAYTRDGSWKLSSDGNLVNSSGYVLEPGVTIDDNVMGLKVSKDGVIEVNESGGGTATLGNIELAKFINPAGLKAIGDNLYVETESSGTPISGAPGSSGFGEVNQGFLEASNVDIVEEMINMITAQRSYEINSKTVKTVEEMMSISNNLVR